MPTSRAFLSTLLLTLQFTVAAAAAFGQEPKPSARKFDEFGDIEYSDLIARLDNFAIQLQNEPAAKGFILVYRTRRDLPGLSNAIALRSKNYLLNSRGVTRDRVVTVDGGEADCQVQELWIVPVGTAPTPRPDAYPRDFPDLDSARKIDEYGFDPLDRGKESATWFGADESGDYLETFATQLKREPKTLACIIVYAQFNPRPGLVDYEGNYEPVRDVRLDRKGIARQRLNTERTRLIKLYGIAPSRIRLLDGGYRKRRTVELWIVPRSEHLPIPTPNSFPSRQNMKKG
jgi:hypothetical protein